MTKPDYEAVSKDQFEYLKDNFKTADKDRLVAEIRGLFDDPEGELVYLKKKDTLALADRLEAVRFEFLRSMYVEMLDSLTE